MRSSVYSLRIVRRPALPIRVLSTAINALAIIGLILFVLIAIDGFFFNSRGLFNVLIWTIER